MIPVLLAEANIVCCQQWQMVSYFQLDDDNKIKYTYYLNHYKING